MKWWHENHYTSLNAHLDSSSEEEEEEEEEEGEEEEIHYVVGDVTHPQHTGTADALIVHCVGEWRATTCSSSCLLFLLLFPCSR